MPTPSRRLAGQSGGLRRPRSSARSPRGPRRPPGRLRGRRLAGGRAVAEGGVGAEGLGGEGPFEEGADLGRLEAVRDLERRRRSARARRRSARGRPGSGSRRRSAACSVPDDFGGWLPDAVGVGRRGGRGRLVAAVEDVAGVAVERRPASSSGSPGRPAVAGAVGLGSSFGEGVAAVEAGRQVQVVVELQVRGVLGRLRRRRSGGRRRAEAVGGGGPDGEVGVVEVEAARRSRSRSSSPVILDAWGRSAWQMVHCWSGTRFRSASRPGGRGGSRRRTRPASASWLAWWTGPWWQVGALLVGAGQPGRAAAGEGRVGLDRLERAVAGLAVVLPHRVAGPDRARALTRSRLGRRRQQGVAEPPAERHQRAPGRPGRAAQPAHRVAGLVVVERDPDGPLLAGRAARGRRAFGAGRVGHGCSPAHQYLMAT